MRFHDHDSPKKHKHNAPSFQVKTPLVDLYHQDSPKKQEKGRNKMKQELKVNFFPLT